MTEDFKARMERLRAQVGNISTPIEQPKSTPKPKQDGALDDGAKAQLRSLDLVSIYRRWFSPASERTGSNGEINLSCFNTEFHRSGDRNPQFGINTADQVYYCHACEVSGDIIDLAAVHYGYADGNFKCPPAEVHEVVKAAGEELCGMSFRKTKAGWQRVPEWSPIGVQLPAANSVGPGHDDGAVLPISAGSGSPGHDGGSSDVAVGTGSGAGSGQDPVRPQQAAPVAFGPAPGVPAQPPTQLGVGVTVGSFTGGATPAFQPDMSALNPPQYTGPRPEDVPEDDDSAEDLRVRMGHFTLEWRNLVPQDSPLYRYMDLVSTDDTPEEFHFWNFMSLIGLICGKKVFIPDAKPVYGNLLTCIIGRSGQGKSRSEGFISDLIQKAAPFDPNDHLTSGIKVIKNPGSGEFLAKEFIHEVPDPTVPVAKATRKVPMLRNPSVKALVRWPEMSTMIGKSATKGSIVQQTVIELYDVPNTIGGGSLTNGSYSAENPFGSIATTTQLESIRNLVTTSDAASGFLNRWIFVIGKEKQFIPRQKPIDVSPMKHDVEMLTKWAESKFRNDGGWLDLEQSAGVAWDEFLVTRARPLEMSEGHMLARSTLLFKKLCLLFSANMMEDKISVASIEQAKIAFEYLIDCLKHIGARVATNEVEEVESIVIDFIKSKGSDGATPSDIRKLVKRKVVSQTTDSVNRFLKVLEEADMIALRAIPQPANRVGAPKKRYFVSEGL